MRSRIWAHKNQSGGCSAGVACYHVSGLGKVAFKGFCVSLLIRRQFSLRLRSRAEWSGVPPEAEVGEAESRNKTVTLGKRQFYIAEISTERSAVCLCVVCLQCFYWLNNGVFYSITQLSCATRENWQQSSRPPQRHASSSSRYQTAY